MEVDVVRHGVAGRVNEGNLDVVAFVHDHEGAGIEPLKVMARSLVPSSSMTICFSSATSRNSMILGPAVVACSWACT